MTSNNEFQEHLQAGRVAEAMSLVIHKLVDLDIVTENISADDTSVKNRLSTQINLLTGIITNEVTLNHNDPEAQQRLMEFHTAQISATNRVVQNNISSLQSLLSLVKTSEIALERPAVAVQPSVKDSNTTPIVSPPTPATVPATSAAKPQPIIATISRSTAATAKTPEPLPETKAAPTPEAVKTPEPLPETKAAPIPEAAKTPEPGPETKAAPTPEAVKTPEPVPETKAAPIPEAVKTPEPLPETKAAPIPEDVKVQETKLPGAAATVATGIVASGMVAAVAQAGSPNLAEGDKIPNRFDQVLKSAGLKEDVSDNPFVSEPLSPAQVIQQPLAANEDVTRLLNESDEEWDEWLLEEDAILTELSQASQEVAKEKIPDWDETWFSQPDTANKTAPSAVEDWEQFIPEYVDLNAPTNNSQANVERFRQNLVNDPQLMNELLAELDDIEKLSREEPPKP